MGVFEAMPDFVYAAQGELFESFRSTATKGGYCVRSMVVNSRDHGSVQTRRRLFMFVIRDDVLKQHGEIGSLHGSGSKRVLDDVLDPVCELDT